MGYSPWGCKESCAKDTTKLLAPLKDITVRTLNMASSVALFLSLLGNIFVNAC